MLAGSPLLGFFAASLMRPSMASFCASKTTLAVSYSASAAACSSRAFATEVIQRFQRRRPRGGFLGCGIAHNATPQVRHDQPESRDFGLIAQRAPMIDPSATTAGAATKSGGQGIRSASSIIQPRSGSGSNVSASKAGTDFSSAVIGFGSGHAPLVDCSSELDCHCLRDPNAHRLQPGMSMEVVEVRGALRSVGPKSGTASQASTAKAASRPLVSPGFAGVPSRRCRRR